jgi:CubicO group peptidase (beta-lactamase class C family)
VFWLERGADRYYKAYGKRAVIPADEVMTEDTIFDAASLTKVIACTPAVLLLVERGQIGLDDAVAKHLPEFAAHGKEGITIRQLLTHTSGLRPDISLKPDWTGAAEAIRLVVRGKAFRGPWRENYLQRHGHDFAGRNRAADFREIARSFLQTEVYERLGMKDTGFNPHRTKMVARGPDRGGKRRSGARRGARSARPAHGRRGGACGIVHLCSDLARYARMLLNLGELDGVRVFKPETVQAHDQCANPGECERGAAAWAGILTPVTADRVGNCFRSARTVTPAGPGPPSGLIRSRSRS